MLKEQNIKIATPVSHLFKDPEDAELIISVSDCLECRDDTILENYSGEELYHCELQPIHIWNDSEISLLERIVERKRSLKVISFHMASSCTNPQLIGNRFERGDVYYDREELLQNAKRNFEKIRSILGHEMKFAVENNNYFPTAAYEHIADAKFITEIVHSCNLFFLFDLAHAHISAANMNTTYSSYVKQLPIDSAIQLHISRFAFDDDGMAYDSHEIPSKFEWSKVVQLMKKNKRDYVSIEYYKDTKTLVKELSHLRSLINELP